MVNFSSNTSDEDSGINSPPQPSPLLCKVCGNTTENYNFGAQMCRACALFFKRCVLEKKKYTCTTGKYDCYISNERSERSKCRACRFLKCKQAGAVYKVLMDETILTSNRDEDYNCLHCPTIIHMVDGLRKYHAAQHEWVKRHHPEADFSGGMFIVPSKVENIGLKCGTIPDLLEMLQKNFGPFSELSKNDQLKILGNAYEEFRVLNECYLSAFYYPSISENRLVFAPGYYVEPGSSIPEKTRYLKGFLESDEVPGFERLVKPFRTRFQELRRQFKRLQLSLLDTVVLMMMSIWKYAEFNHRLSPSMDQFREQVMKEWTESLAHRFYRESNKKLAEIMLFYKELDRNSIDSYNAATQVKIMRAQRSHDYDDSIEEALAKLKMSMEVSSSSTSLDDSSLTPPQKSPMLCAVCTKETGNFNFGAQVCRACALFFKRCILEKKKYTCTNGQYDCDITHDRSERSRCRACRFLKCRQAGINYKADDILSMSNRDDDSNWINFPTIVRLMDGLKKYHAIQLDIVKRKHPEADFTNGMCIIPQKVENIRLKFDTIPDLVEMFTRHFGPFSELSRNDQVKIVGDAHAEFRVLNECYLTAYHCPGLDDNRLVFAPGYWVDPAKMDEVWYHKGFLEPDEIERFKSLVTPFRHQFREHRRRFKKMNLSLLDTVVLVLVSIWKHTEYRGKMTKAMDEFREKVLKEWMISLGHRFNGKHNEKLSQIMLLYKGIDRSAIVSNNTIMQVRILRSQRRHEWEFCIDDALARLKVEE